MGVEFTIGKRWDPLIFPKIKKTVDIDFPVKAFNKKLANEPVQT